jgi:hypothetical protein
MSIVVKDNVNRQASPSSSPRTRRMVVVAGLLLIAAGLILNEWWVEAFLTHDGSLSPVGRTALRGIDAFLVLLGLAHLLLARGTLILNLDLAIASTLLVLVVAEVALRVHPALLGPSFAVRVDPERAAQASIFYDGLICGGNRVQLLKPSYEKDLDYRGYHWKHRTDRHGFRSPVERERADLLLLGDSFIYGLCQEVDKTVAAFLERDTALSVANLSKPGNCAYDEVHLLHHHIGLVQPRYVVLFFYQNDIEDLASKISPAAMQEFLELPLGGLPACQELAVPALDPDHAGPLRVASPYVLLAMHELAHRQYRNAARATRDKLPDRQDDLAWKFTIRAIEQMKHTCDEHRADLILVPILPSAERADYDILARTAERLGIVFVDSWASLRVDAHLEYYLPRDGHFSEIGAEAVARLVAERLPSQPRVILAP